MDHLSSINLSSVEEKEDQQIVTLVEASEIGDSNPLVHVLNSGLSLPKTSVSLEAHGSHCLICNGKLVVSARGAMEIFSNKVKTSTRNLNLDSLLGKILDRELIISNIHSSIICKKCFKLLDYIDCVEGQLIEMKQEVTNKFLNTESLVREFNNQVLINEKEDQSEVFPRITNGDKEYKFHAIKKNKSKRGHRGRRKKNSIHPSLVKLEVKEESDDILPTCFNLDEDAMSDIEGNHENEIDEDENEIILYDDTIPVNYHDFFFEIDGLDVQNPGNSIQVGEFLLPTFNDEQQFGGVNLGHFSEKGLGRFRCRFCKIRRHSLKVIQSHILKVHSDRLFECEVCDERFIDLPQMLEHLEQHILSGDTPFSCQHCTRSFALPRLLQEHLQRHYKGKTLACYQCPKIFRRESALEEHLNTHTGSRPYKCEFCFKHFSSKPTLRAHMKIHSARTRSFKCNICKKLFLTSHHLNDHLQIHQNSKNFSCSVCKKAFCTQRSLDLHFIIHSGVKNYYCRMCNKAFARKGEVQDHERIHTGERPFQCEICGAQFSQRSNLQTHKRSTHFKEKRYECTQCSKAFKRKRLLVYHVMSVHTGERPYKCGYCKAAFVYPEHYKKHLRIHSGEKPFKCEICGKAFNSRDNKNAHKFIHSDKKQYECTLCGVGFMRKPQLVAHILQHGTTENTDSFIKVNPASIVDAEMIDSDANNRADQSLEHTIQIVRAANGETVGLQVVNQPFIVDGENLPRYIIPNVEMVDIKSDDLDDLTASQLNQITDVTSHMESSSDPSADSSEHIQPDSNEFVFKIMADEVKTSPRVSHGSTIVRNVTKPLKNNSLSTVGIRHVQVSLETFKKMTQGQDIPTKSKNWIQ